MTTRSLYKLILVLFVVMASIPLQAQTYAEDDNPSQATSIQDLSAERNYLSEQQTNTGAQAYSERNNIYIQQAGNNNTVHSETTSSSSDINFLQYGNDNSIYFKVAADRIQQNVTQSGTNHHFTEYGGSYGNEYLGPEVQQSGNGQNLTMYGSNSISEKMKISMEGAGRAIEVRNFN